MTSRERLQKALSHQQPDRPPVDIGATAVTGIHALALQNLRNALGLKEAPIKIYEVLQQLGWIEPEDAEALGIDVVGIMPYTNFVGDHNINWKTYECPFGFEALCAGTHAIVAGSDGRRYLYPQSDPSISPSMVMPQGGYFFDAIHRCPTLAEACGSASLDFDESFPVMSGEEGQFYHDQSEWLHQNTDFGVIGNLAPAGFGDFAFLPGTALREPKGVRHIEEWIILHKVNLAYIHELFDLQAARAIVNLKKYQEAVQDRIQAIFMGGTDFGTQRGLFMDVSVFRELYMPYWKRVNDWVHQNTGWKTFYHSCGAIEPLIPSFIEAGMDILNPVQCSAAGMDAAKLKEKYGGQVVFWGGGLDTQRVLPFGTPEETAECVREQLRIFGKGGGYVWNTVHNIQANTPVPNMLAMLEALR